MSPPTERNNMSKSIQNSLLFILILLMGFSFITEAAGPDTSKATIFFPADGATNVNPDTHLKLTFPVTSVLGNSGRIRIYDAADNRLIDILDLAFLRDQRHRLHLRMQHIRRYHTGMLPAILPTPILKRALPPAELSLHRIHTS